MSVLLDEAVAAIRKLSTRDQDEIARTMIQLTCTSAGRDPKPGSVTHAGKIDAYGENVGSGLSDDFRLWPRSGRR